MKIVLNFRWLCWIQPNKIDVKHMRIVAQLQLISYNIIHSDIFVITDVPQGENIKKIELISPQIL